MSQTTSTIQFKYSFNWIVAPQITGCITAGVILIALGVLVWGALIFLSVIPFGYGLYLYLDWQYTIYTITPETIIKRQGIFFELRDEIPIRGILKKKYVLYIPGADVGNILLETAAQSGNNGKNIEGDLIISNVENLSHIYELIGQLQKAVPSTSIPQIEEQEHTKEKTDAETK